MAKRTAKRAKKNGKSGMTFMGWRRENGRVGVRNHVVILPLDDISNACLRSRSPTRSRARSPFRTPMAGCNSAPTSICFSAR